jgi:phospholipid-translocating ATPase
MSMSFLRRHQRDDDYDSDQVDDESIDPQLRLRTVRTAASAIAESIKSDQRAEKRNMRRKKSRFFRNLSERKRSRSRTTSMHTTTSAPQAQDSTHIPGIRRNVYVNRPPLPVDVDEDGEPLARYVRNKVRTSSTLSCLVFSQRCPYGIAEYTILTFIPKNLYEQFRRYVSLLAGLRLPYNDLRIRVANLYFFVLVILQRKFFTSEGFHLLIYYDINSFPPVWSIIVTNC